MGSEEFARLSNGFGKNWIATLPPLHCTSLSTIAALMNLCTARQRWRWALPIKFWATSATCWTWHSLPGHLNPQGPHLIVGGPGNRSGQINGNAQIIHMFDTPR
jgi:hypothetical protein